MNYQKYKNMIKNKFFACALLLGLTAVALQAQLTIGTTSTGGGNVVETSAPGTPIYSVSVSDLYVPSDEIQAVPDTGKVFSHWEYVNPADEDVINIYPDKDTDTVKLTLLNTTESTRAVRAVFVNSPVDVTVTSQSSGGIPVGDPVPTHGVNAIPLGTDLYAGVRSPYPGNTGVRYNCTGFTGTGDFLPTSPNTNTTTEITQASTITWNWDTQYQLSVNVANGGANSRVDISPANRTWYNDGEQIVLTAQPGTGYNFVRWDNPGGPVDGLTDLMVNFNISAPQNITAVFEPYPALSLDIISRDENNAHVAGYSYVGDTTRFHTYNTLIDISVDSTVLSSSGRVREHCMGYTSTGGNVTPASILNTEISAISPFAITANTTITLDWVREYRIRLGIAGTASTNGYDVSYLSYSPQRTHTSPPWFRAGDTVTISAASLTEGEIFLQWDSAPFGIDPYSPINTFVVTGAADINARFASADLDSDLDGMPDVWEARYGLDPNDPRDANEDPDNDGLSNLQEYLISQVLLEAGVAAEISPINADSSGDGMIDGYKYNHILIPGSGTPVGQSRNALAVVSSEGDNGPNGNPDGDYHWSTTDGYEDTNRGLLNIEEYVGPDNVPPYNLVIVNDPSLSSLPILQAQVNPLDSNDTSWSDTTDTDEDGFDDGFEYTWDQWQGAHGGESARDPMNHVIPDRFGISALPMTVVNADVDGDGIQDLVGVCYEQELVSVLLGDGAAGFNTPVTYPLGTGVNPVSLVADDFNDDGFIDIITANADGSYSVLFGTGDMTDLFPVITTYPLGSSFIAVESADLDGANGPDIIFADLNNAVYVALNDGAGDFSNVSLVPLSDTPGDIKLAPIYSDTASAGNDLVVTIENDTIEIFANDGLGGFTSATVIALPVGSVPGACDVADFNDNGYNDIVTVCTGDNYVRVYLNFDGSGVFNKSDDFFVQADAGLVDVVAADFTTYGNTNPSVNETIDFAVVAYNLNSVFLYSGNGLGKFSNSGNLATSEGPLSVLFAELRTAPPAYLDLIVVESLTDSIVEFLNNGSGNLSPYSQFDVSSRIVDRRFNPAAIHIQDDVFGRPDYDLVYHIESGRAVAWFTDFLEYNVWQDGGQIIGNYFIPQIIGGSSDNRRSSHPFYWDADGDGLPDGWEIAYGYDPWFQATFGGVNDADANPDGDWFAVEYDNAGNVIAKHKEIYDQYGFDPRTGYYYMPPVDLGNLGPHTAEYNNLQELLGSSYMPAIRPNDPNDGGTCPIALDADGDGVWDGWELYVGMDPTDPTDAGADWDTLNAYPWAPANGDGLSNFEEFHSYATSTNVLSAIYRVAGWYNKTLPTDPHDYDTDWDQVTDADERAYFNFSDSFNGGGLCPTAADTDGDRIPDAWEAFFAGYGDTDSWAGGMNGTAHDAYLDYDGDGLLNYQEYFTGANYGWRYDRFVPNLGAGAYDPYDFFSEAEYGRLVKTWDPSYFLDPPFNRVNLHFLLGSETVTPMIGPYFQTCDPTNPDSDLDGLNDYWEVFHGLNPLYGYDDVVAYQPVDELAIPYVFWHSARDFNRTPWISGFPNFDPDQDGLVTYEEGIFVDAIPYHHTDPSPMWMTDISAQLSYVNLYYWTGRFDYNFEWYWGDYTYGGRINPADYGISIPPLPGNPDNRVIDYPLIYPAPRFAYSYEINEGYDTDNDGINDRDELNDTIVSPGVSDPLDNMSPNINRVLYLNGEAYTETPMSYGWVYPDYRTYTVEAWVKAEELPTAKKQIVVQRAGYLSNSDQFNPNVLGWRRNFELGLTKDGKPYLLYDTPAGQTFEAVANFAVETDKWYHISGSYEGEFNSQKQWVGKLNVYLDGVLVKSLPASIMPANSYQGASVPMPGTMTFVVGNGYQEADPNTYFFKGWVDNVRAWGASQPQDTIQENMKTTFNRTQATTFATNLATRLLYSFSFNDLPDPQIDNITPDGFDALVGYPANYTAIPFWRSMADRSKVYNDYKYLPWIDNQSLHYPRPIASDTVITNNVTNIDGMPVNYPNTSDPYGYKYLTGTLLANTQDPAIGPSFWPSYESIIHPDLLANVPVFADMLPMLYAVTTESVQMWDDIPARSIDSDGDGMPDLWEVAMGLDPHDATGINGAYGDYDRDGLANIYEYYAGTSPLEYASTTNNVPDFFAWGNNITGALNHDYRTFGELLTDHDMMEDEWEILNGLNPFLHDAFQDADGDGWSNYAEFRYDSDPQDQQSIPFAELNFRFKYFGDSTRLPSGTILKIMTYTDVSEGADSVMEYEIGMEVEAVSGQRGRLNFLPVAGSVVFTDINGRTFFDNGIGALIENSTGLPMGSIDYITGNWTLDAVGFMVEYQRADGSIFPMLGSAGFVFEISAGTRYTYIREGLNTFFVFADLNNDGIWDPATEPAGTTDNGPIMLAGDTPELIEISLKDYATGFPRLSWPVMQSAVSYRLNVALGNYQLFSVTLPPEKYFFMESDYMEFYGNAVPEGIVDWSIDVLTQSGAYSNNYVSGTFDVNYPDYIEVPEIVSPNTSVKSAYYRVKFVWDNADKATPFYELQIANDQAFTDIIKTKTGFIPGDFAGQSTVTLPEIGSGFVWEDKQTYYWRVRSKTSNAVGAWSTAIPFRIDYDADPLYTCSIEGTAFYTGKAKTGTIIVEAYDNKSFSGTPLSIDYMANNPTPELWPMNPNTYKLDGLVAGTYYVRAFLDQNNNRLKDDFETYGYVASGTDFYAVKPIVLAYDGVRDETNQDLFMVVADTDNDMLADDWEWSYAGTLTVMGAGEVRGFTDFDGNGVNDFEAYAWSALNMSPFDGDAAGADNIPYALKADFGLCVIDDIDFSLKGIDIDKYDNLYISWNGLGGTSYITLSNDNGSKALSVTAGNSTVHYTLQYSTDMNNWIDVETGEKSQYIQNSDMFIYTGQIPNVSAIENNEPLFFRFKVTW